MIHYVASSDDTRIWTGTIVYRVCQAFAVKVVLSCAGWRAPPAVMSRLALLLVLLVFVLAVHGRSQKNGKRKSGRRAVLAQQPPPGGENDNNNFYDEYYEEYDGYDEYENGGQYYRCYCCYCDCWRYKNIKSPGKLIPRQIDISNCRNLVTQKPTL